MNISKRLEEGFIDSLGRVLAEVQREWRREANTTIAEGRAIIAELKAENTSLKAANAALVAELREQVATTLASVKDGAPGPAGPQGEPGERGEKGDAGEPGPQGEPGIGIEGKEGPAGRDGRDGLPGVPGDKGRDGVDGQKGLDGKDGRDGVDGLGFDDLTEELSEDGREIIRRYSRGDLVKEFRFPLAGFHDRGVWKAGSFKKGDGVTWGGSFFIAQVDTDAKPETNSDWRLAVKRGRDGKDGKNGSDGPMGPQGKPGRDGGWS